MLETTLIGTVKNGTRTQKAASVVPSAKMDTHVRENATPKGAGNTVNNL